MKYKYPRTPHLPSSPGTTSDDKKLKGTDHLRGKEVVVTVKMDGENSTLYRDGAHARSLDGKKHPSRNWLAAFHAGFAHDIPEGWRVCGESLFAQHSIAYDALPSYFMGFSAWNEKNKCLSWDDTIAFFNVLGIEPVQLIYRGEFDDKRIADLVASLDLEKQEGIVVRLAQSFSYEDFGVSIAKWVRQGHVQTDKHWMHQAVVANGLALPMTDEDEA